MTQAQKNDKKTNKIKKIPQQIIYKTPTLPQKNLNNIKLRHNFISTTINKTMKISRLIFHQKQTSFLKWNVKISPL